MPEDNEKSPEDVAIEFLTGFLKSDPVDSDSLKVRAAESILNHSIMKANAVRYDFPSSATKAEGE